MKSRIGALIVVASLALGCATSAVYENDWARQVKVETGACPDIDGEYQNAGDATLKVGWGKRKRQALSLAHFMNGGWSRDSHRDMERLGTTYYNPALDWFRTVRLRRAGEELQVEAVHKDGGTTTFVLPTHRECRDSILPVETTMHASPFSGTAAHGSYSLGRAEDGSLLVYVHVVDTFLLALWGSTDIWVRFPPAVPEPASGPVVVPTP